MRVLCISIVLLAAGICQAGQQLPDPATYRPANAAEVARLQEQWLHSDDPRWVAWAAELIAENGHREQIAGLIAQINRLPSLNAKSPAAIPDAMLAVADALIQLHARVPADVVVKLPYWSTPQQLILLADSPDGRDPLMTIFERTAVPLEWLAAANLIAEAPTAAFARSLLNDFKIQLSVEVITPGMATGGSGGGCGGSWGGAARGVDWPPINQYALSLTKGIVFTSGVHPVRYYAFQSYKDREPIDCASTSKDRFLPGLLAEVSRIPFNELRLQSRIAETVVYRGRDSYLANMRMILAPLNDDFRRLVASYVRLGFLSASESLDIRLPIYLKVTDSRLPGAPALPALPEFDCLRIEAI